MKREKECSLKKGREKDSFKYGGSHGRGEREIGGRRK